MKQLEIGNFLQSSKSAKVLSELWMSVHDQNTFTQTKKLSSYGSISKIQRKNHYLQIQNFELGRKNHYLQVQNLEIEGKTTTYLQIKIQIA